MAASCAAFTTRGRHTSVRHKSYRAIAPQCAVPRAPRLKP